MHSKKIDRKLSDRNVNHQLSINFKHKKKKKKKEKMYSSTIKSRRHTSREQSVKNILNKASCKSIHPVVEHFSYLNLFIII